MTIVEGWNEHHGQFKSFRAREIDLGLASADPQTRSADGPTRRRIPRAVGTDSAPGSADSKKRSPQNIPPNAVLRVLAAVVNPPEKTS
ncbi:hypothetical protein [Variovorax sp. W2I14]|uniref:hypothetical protein n=1 Tax=Variovorax sp. W2I14 TaxID=3042290 RepID=UPI003D2015D8